jgi:hypothetical protein
MDAETIINIILGVLLAISAVPWAVLWQRGSSLKKAGQDLVDRYRSGVADGKITEAEKAEMGEAAIRIIEEGLSIWTTLDNLIREIAKIVTKKR